jgi:multidrug resistance efflux pump
MSAPESPPPPAPAPPTPPAPGSAPAPANWQPPPLRWRAVATAVVLAIVAVVAVLSFWRLPPFDRGVVETDNAYVHALTTDLAAQVSGNILEVGVTDFAIVKAGQVLFRIDDRTYRARVEQAQANLEGQQAQLDNQTQAHASRAAQIRVQDAALASARAQATRTQADMRRASNLVGNGSISVRELDQTHAGQLQAEAAVHQAEAALAVAREDLRSVDVGRGALVAQVDAARAALHAAQVDLQYTVVVAPREGQLGQVGAHVGQYVGSGTQLVTLVPNERWVIAEFKEAQTAKIRARQTATFRVDALDGKEFHGHVGPRAPATGSEFAVLKPDNATGNFVKVPQRIGIYIAIDPDQADANLLAPGMSVIARVDTTSTK